MKTIVRFIAAVFVLISASPLRAGSFSNFVEEARKAQQQQEANIKRIKAETEKQQAAAKTANAARQKAIEELKLNEESKKLLQKMSDANAEQIAQLNEQLEAIEKQNENLRYLDRLLQLKTLKLEIVQAVLAVSTLGFLVTTIRGLRSGKLSDRKTELEIEKLEREKERDASLKTASVATPQAPPAAGI
jgi:hypothetical protein